MEALERPRGLSGNALKLIAILAMTFDHLLWVIWPGYDNGPVLLLLHSFGRVTAPIMCFFIAEGCHYTHDRRRYALRLLLFAIVSHFAYNFAFGIPYVPFQTGIFNQTSVMWSLFWGLIALCIHQSEDARLKPWMKTAAMLIICLISFPSDWSCIAVLVIVFFGAYRGNFRKQALFLMLFVAMYAAVYCIWIDVGYGLLQLCVALSIPLLKQYNGTRGRWKGMKWFFYLFYPAHLLLCGILRLALHGNIGVLVGGG